MPEFRYEAVDQSGVPIHGTTKADSESALAARLRDAGQRLVSAVELSVQSALSEKSLFLPRLFQLRVGEQLREALLTGLPAHKAIRAVAAEPITHPMSDFAAWLHTGAIVLFLICSAVYVASLQGFAAMMVTGALALVVGPCLRLTVRWLYETRPRALLKAMANRLESGVAVDTDLALALPHSLRVVMKSDLDDSEKARVTAELVPLVMAGQFRFQQFALSLVGPFLACGFVMTILHAAMVGLIPKFKQIFDDFDTTLPSLTSGLVSLSDFFVLFGWGGWAAAATTWTVVAVLMVFILAQGRVAWLLASIPFLGMAFRWAMQARVASILSTMIRQGCSYAEAVKTATAASGFPQVASCGEVLAKRLQLGEPFLAEAARPLSALPVSMLFADQSGVAPDERRAAVAETFRGLAEMLESATVGQSRLLTVIVHWMLVVFVGLSVGVGVLSLFLPIIKLLNDLS